MEKKKNNCRICNMELDSPRHFYCRACFDLVREDQAEREEKICSGKMDKELGIIDRTEWI
jgi:hypothetical protein